MNVEGKNGQLLMTTILDPMYESDDEEDINDDVRNGNETGGVVVGNNNSRGRVKTMYSY